MEAGKDKKASMKTTQSMRTTQSFGVGKIAPPGWLWSSLEATLKAEGVRNGVLIIFSEDIGGRIGVFCNRYISGAVTDRTNFSGLEALKLLLSIKSGMFAFRPCLAAEGAELKQNLALDIVEVLEARETAGKGVTPADVLSGLLVALPEPQMSSVHFSEGEAGLPEFGENLGASGLFYTPATTWPALSPKESESLPAGDIARAAEPTGEPNYLDWFSADQDKSGQKTSLSQILRTALLMPAIEGADDPTASGSFDLQKYRDLVENESEKIAAQLERPPGEASKELTNQSELMDDLRLYGEMLKTEGNRVKGWLSEDLDALGTPEATGSRQSRSAAGRSQFTAECEDLFSESLIGKFKEARQFIKDSARHEVLEPSSVSYWRSHPRLVGAAGLAVVLLALLLIGHFATVGDRGTLLDEGMKALSSGKPEEAVVYLNEAVNKSPDYGRAYFCRGLAYQSLNEPEKALADLSKAESLGEPKALVLTTRASVETMTHAYDKAIEDCTNAILDDPKNVEAFKLRAISHSRLDHYDRAIDDCSKALQLSPDSGMRAQLLAERGFARAKNGDVAGGIEDLSSSLKLKPSRWAVLQRADAYRDGRKFAEAIQDYSEVLKSKPDSYFALVARGICHMKLNETDAATKDFDQAIKINRSGLEALIQRGSLELDQKQWQAAADDLQQAIHLNPSIAESHDKLSIALHHLKSTLQPRATVAIETPEQIKLPADMASLMRLGYRFLNNGALDDAVLCFNEALTREPRSAMAPEVLVAPAGAMLLIALYTSLT